jgi:transcriptional regulator with XRE-family HTH domain
MDDQRREYAASLAGVIMERRAALGIGSQAELARLVGVSEATAGRWERQTHLPNAWELRRLCEVLEVDPDELLHPQPLTPRERQELRRAGRQVRKSVDRGRQAS